MKDSDLIAQFLATNKVKKVSKSATCGMSGNDWRHAVRGTYQPPISEETISERRMELSREHAHTGDKDAAEKYAGGYYDAEIESNIRSGR